MQIDKVYGLYCHADNGHMNSPFFSTRREAIEYLDVFQSEILEENENELEAHTKIELLVIDLSDVNALAEQVDIHTVSSWRPCEGENFYGWHDFSLVSAIKES